MARAHYWLLRHPCVGRPLAMVAWLQLLAITAVCAAPAASASTNAVMLNWTGLRDTYGVPIGNYYLSLASIEDQLTQTGPDASVWDPGTWAPWMMHGLNVMFTNFAAANVLTAEAGIFVGVIAVSLWVMRLTISTYWLTLLGEIARAVTTAVITVTTRWGLVALTVPIGVFLGVLAIRRGEGGRGATMILLAILMPALAVTVFSDPAGMMYGPDGLLQFARRVAFSTAEAATNNGAIGGGGFTGQVDTLTSSLITHVVREPLEVFNFGHVVDGVGECAAQYSQALLQGLSDGPVKAMARCGDAGAVHYAQNLDGTNVFVGLALVFTAALFGWFMISSGASVFMVSVKAMYTTAKLLPSVFAGGISGAAREHAKSTVWKFFKHPLEAMVFISFVSVIGLAIERLISRPLPAELGGASPFAHILIMAGASVAALYLLRHIRADLEGRPPGRGLFGRATDVALGLGMRAALGGASGAALSGLHGMHGLRRGAAKTPWEQIDDKAANAADVLGPAQEGFAPIPSEPDGAPPGGAPESAPSTPTAGGGQLTVDPADRAARGLDPLAGATATPARPRGRRGPASAAPSPSGATAPRQFLDGGGAQWAAVPGAEVEPITEGGEHGATWRDGAPPLSAYVDHTADVPLPPPPPDDDDLSPGPPPQDPGPEAATVEPITDS
jgi:hypothetical protein